MPYGALCTIKHDGTNSAGLSGFLPGFVGVFQSAASDTIHSRRRCSDKKVKTLGSIAASITLVDHARRFVRSRDSIFQQPTQENEAKRPDERAEKRVGDLDVHNVSIGVSRRGLCGCVFAGREEPCGGLEIDGQGGTPLRQKHQGVSCSSLHSMSYCCCIIGP